MPCDPQPRAASVRHFPGSSVQRDCAELSPGALWRREPVALCCTAAILTMLAAVSALPALFIWWEVISG